MFALFSLKSAELSDDLDDLNFFNQKKKKKKQKKVFGDDIEEGIKVSCVFVSSMICLLTVVFDKKKNSTSLPVKL